MLIGAHAIIYSTKPDADRDFLRHVLRLPHVDVGHGWLIFGLPPSEVAVHPADKNGTHELFFMCDDLDGFVAEMKGHLVDCAPIMNQGWGLVTHVTLPGGGTVGVYQPRHARPEPMTADIPAKGRAGRRARKPPTRRIARTIKRGGATRRRR